MNKKLDELRADIQLVPDSLSIGALWDKFDTEIDKLYELSKEALSKAKGADLTAFALGLLVENPHGPDVTNELNQSPVESDQ